MANFVFNIAKGKAAYYAGLPAANDSLVIVPLETSGLETDAVLIDKDSLADVLAGATNEQTTMGRKTASGVTVTVDDANDRVDVDMADVTWSAATGNAVSKLVVCYKPDTASSDSDMIPLSAHDFVVTPNGGDIAALIATAGFYRAS